MSRCGKEQYKIYMECFQVTVGTQQLSKYATVQVWIQAKLPMTLTNLAGLLTMLLLPQGPLSSCLEAASYYVGG